MMTTPTSIVRANLTSDVALIVSGMMRTRCHACAGRAVRDALGDNPSAGMVRGDAGALALIALGIASVRGCAECAPAAECAVAGVDAAPLWAALSPAMRAALAALGNGDDARTIRYATADALARRGLVVSRDGSPVVSALGRAVIATDDDDAADESAEYYRGWWTA
jgi:hypothetical protein